MNFVLWGFIILIATLVLFGFSALDDKELNWFQFLIDRRMYQPRVRSFPPPTESSPVVLLSLFSFDNNTERYLQTVNKIVQDLKRVETKAVLVDARHLLGTSKSIQLFQQLEKTGLVVFGFQPGSSYRIGHFQEKQVQGEGFYTMVSMQGWPGRLFIPRVFPAGIYGMVSSFSLSPSGIPGWRVRSVSSPQPDVSLALLRKFHDYPDSLEPVVREGKVLFGEYKIPLMGDGSLYIRNKDLRPSLHLYANYGPDRELEYHSDLGGSLKISSSLDRYVDYLKGKMVIIGWTYAGAVSESSFWQPLLYVETVLNILQKRFVRSFEYLHVVISILLLFVSALITNSVRPFIALQLLLLLSIAVFIVGYWLFEYHDALVNIMYSSVAVALAAFVFPTVKAAHELRQIS